MLSLIDWNFTWILLISLFLLILKNSENTVFLWNISVYIIFFFLKDIHRRTSNLQKAGTQWEGRRLKNPPILDKIFILVGAHRATFFFFPFFSFLFYLSLLYFLPILLPFFIKLMNKNRHADSTGYTACL